MRSLRLFLLLITLAFSFGGFLFYASVVVPLGSSVVGTTTQGFVTRQVTNVLNAATVVAIGMLLWDIVVDRKRRSRSAHFGLSVCTAIIALCTLSLIMIHPRLDALLLVEELSVEDTDQFYNLHRVYLWISTLQWLCSLPVFWILANRRDIVRSGKE